jgi:hypothetical protein
MSAHSAHAVSGTRPARISNPKILQLLAREGAAGHGSRLRHRNERAAAVGGWTEYLLAPSRLETASQEMPSRSRKGG